MLNSAELKEIHRLSGRSESDRMFPLVYFVTRPLSFAPSAILIQLGVSANQVTAAATAVGLLGFIAISHPHLPRGLGPLFLGIWALADSIDGNIARATKSSSSFGAFFDQVCGLIVGGMVFFAALCATQHSSASLPLGQSDLVVLAAGATVFYFLAICVSLCAKTAVPDSFPLKKTSALINAAKNLSALINIVPLCGLAALFGVADLFLAFYALWNAATFIYIFWITTMQISATRT